MIDALKAADNDVLESRGLQLQAALSSGNKESFFEANNALLKLCQQLSNDYRVKIDKWCKETGNCGRGATP